MIARRHAIPLLAVAALLAPAASAHAACRHASDRPTAKTLKQARAATLCLINAERTKRDRVALRDDRALYRAAVGHSRDMVKRGYFDHTSPTGSDPGDRIRAVGYRFSTWGENIAWGSGSYATPKSIVRSWMNSSGHRRNILDGDFRESGIGVAIGAPQSTGGVAAATYTHVFGTPPRG